MAGVQVPNLDLRDLPQVGSGGAPPTRDRVEERHGPPVDKTEQLGQSAPVGAGAASGPLAAAPAPLLTFEGLHFNEKCGGVQCGDGHPPDTNGDVGPLHYVETINTAFAVYDKATGSRIVGVTFNDFFSQGELGNLCDTDNFGDPVVLYDTFHDRWIITDFAFQVDDAGNIVSPPGSFQCFAVSRTGNPVSGGWNFYSLPVTDALQDYPKFGVWPDGLYMSANMFGFAAGSAFKNVRVFALDLAQMEAGAASVKSVSFNVPVVQQQGQKQIAFTLLPSNARMQTGTPPAGRENLFVGQVMTSTSIFVDRLRVWKFHADFNNLGASTFGSPATSLTSAGNPATWLLPPNEVPAKNGNDLDTLGFRPMMQNQYSFINSVESLWVTHSAQGSSASQSAVRWYQVPVTGGNVGAALQASTWNPSSANRFMPSLAVDRLGDLAIGYSVSTSTLFPAIRYAGRLAGAAANTFNLTETSLIEGTGSQTGNCGGDPCHRWGDYSAMSLDPDGCTFWYTNEYYATSGLDHHTRIGAFRFPGCTNLPVPTPTGDVNPPTITKAPAIALRANAKLGVTSIPVRVSWSATDASGVASYDLQESVNGGPWTDLTLPSPTTTSLDLGRDPGNTYRFRVRATDNVGNESLYLGGPPRTLNVAQETAAEITYSAGWTQQNNANAYGGALKFATASTATATFTFTGRSVAWVAPRASNRGIAEVWIDGSLAATVDLFASSLQARRTVFVKSFTSSALHTIQIRVQGTATRPRVDVDAFPFTTDAP